MAWFDDPDLILADCDAEDRFVYNLARLLTPGTTGDVARARVHAFAQALLDRAADRGCVPADLAIRDLAREARSVGLESGLISGVTYRVSRVRAAPSDASIDLGGPGPDHWRSRSGRRTRRLARAAPTAPAGHLFLQLSVSGGRHVA